MGMPLPRQWTTADVRALSQEDCPCPWYELIDGELLVTPAPRGPHQFAAMEFAVRPDCVYGMAVRRAAPCRVYGRGAPAGRLSMA